jgi:hypothetical protein
MIINTSNTGSNYSEKRFYVIRELLQHIENIGGSLTPSELNWAIKMEVSFKEYNNLTDRQVSILVDILAKHEDD